MPYYPHHSLDLRNEKHRHFLEDIQRVAPTYTYVPNYPYISDLSFIRQPKEEDITDLQRLIPGYDQVRRIDWSVLDLLDIPIINIGPWGKDAHKFTERVYIPSIVEVYQILSDYLRKKFSSNL
jgi:arginine utilization protein RocB